MSCFVLNYQKTAQLADFIAAVLNNGFNSFGFTATETLAMELKDYCLIGGFFSGDKIFDMLVTLNHLACEGRYKKEPMKYRVDVPAHSQGFKYDRKRIVEFVDGGRRGYDLLEPWHYQMLKTLMCFNYQCAEDATINTNLYKGLKELEREMMTYMIMNQPDFVSASWG